MEIIYASLQDAETIERITYDTINYVYPRYYPKGASGSCGRTYQFKIRQNINRRISVCKVYIYQKRL